MANKTEIEQGIIACNLIKAVYESIRIHEAINPQFFAIGKIENRMSEYAKSNGIKLATRVIYISYKQIAHATRTQKQHVHKAVSIEKLQIFPLERFNMDLYYDSLKKNFVYTNYKEKYIIDPDRELREIIGKPRKVAFVTASIVEDVTNFRMRQYKKI